MKLISLNTWGGKIFEPLIEFIKQQAEDTDIFCFQEMYNTKSNTKTCGNFRANLLGETKNILSDFQIFYFPVVRGFDDEGNPVNFDLSFGQAIFVKNRIKIVSTENTFVYREKGFQFLKKDFSNLPTPLQYVTFESNNKMFTIFNFHGSPIPGDKLDTEKRLTETQKVKAIIDNEAGAKILVGDFNLLPETQSIKIFEQDMKNLIKAFEIQRTRSKESPFFGKSNFQKFADYTFVSTDIRVENFQVPRVEISDHLPMILEFS